MKLSTWLYLSIGLHNTEKEATATDDVAQKENHINVFFVGKTLTTVISRIKIVLYLPFRFVSLQNNTRKKPNSVFVGLKFVTNN